jgi:hypothetical protein
MEIAYHFGEAHPSETGNIKSDPDPLALKPLTGNTEDLKTPIALVKGLDKMRSVEIARSLTDDDHDLLGLSRHSVTASLPRFPAVH